MNLRNVDLNLLVAFDALMRTRQVTRAARLLGIGQPGMSAALSRLRQLFNDPLLVKRGPEMEPTQRALALAQDVARVLRDVERILDTPNAFDPAHSARQFALRMSDLLSILLLPGLMKQLASTAPGLRLAVQHLAPEATVDALERDSIELAVSTGLAVPKSVESLPLFEDRILCLCHADFEDEDRLADPRAFVALPQIRISQSPLDDRFIDRQLAEIGLERQAALTVPHWLAVPEIVAGGSHVAVMPASLAERFATTHRLSALPLPFLTSRIEWALYWHKRYASDPGHAWLRKRIADVSRGLNPPGR